MTQFETERLAVVEQNQKNMAEDITEVKSDVKIILARLDTMSGENKMLKYVIGVAIAIGGLVVSITHFIMRNN